MIFILDKTFQLNEGKNHRHDFYILAFQNKVSQVDNGAMSDRLKSDHSG